MSDHPERSGATRPGKVPASPAPAAAVAASAATPAAAGTPGNPLRLTDPRMMRALAHPARMAIWQFLGLEGPATATECAEVAGLSPSACSYHLRTLAQYGFVEEDLASAADGRQRPWRARLLAFSFGDGEQTTPAMRDAGRLLASSMSASAEELRASYRDREAEYPARWREALGTSYDVLHATPEELKTLQRRLTDLFGEYRRLSRAERPPGAGRVQVRVDLTPWFEPLAAPPAAPPSEPSATPPEEKS